MTLAEWGVLWLAMRAHEVRSPRTDRARWKVHVLPTSLAALDLRDITRAHVRDWLLAATLRFGSIPHHRAKVPLSASTLQTVLNLVRVALEAAREREYIADNPARGLKLPPRVKARAASGPDRWTVLLPFEQAAVRASTPPMHRALYDAAMGTGLREGELYALEIVDVFLETDAPYLVVRWGGYGIPTKGGKTRRVPLFGHALAAIDAWLVGGGRAAFVRSLRRGLKPEGVPLVFPGLRGGFRNKKAPHGFDAWIAAAGIIRNVRWHDLRHTCASSLLAGWWGRRWTLIEVSNLLGHASLQTTERYAHFAEDLLAKAADESDGKRALAWRRKTDSTSTG